MKSRWMMGLKRGQKNVGRLLSVWSSTPSTHLSLHHHFHTGAVCALTHIHLCRWDYVLVCAYYIYYRLWEVHTKLSNTIWACLTFVLMDFILQLVHTEFPPFLFPFPQLLFLSVCDTADKSMTFHTWNRIHPIWFVAIHNTVMFLIL